MKVINHNRLKHSSSYGTNLPLNKIPTNLTYSTQKKVYPGRNINYSSIIKSRSFSTMPNFEQIVIPPLNLFDSAHILFAQP